MRIEFRTCEYQWVHGRMPRGYGNWCFEFKGQQFWAMGTLTEAKKLCREYVKSVVPSDYVGTVGVNVAP